eukprot:jgi/Hompol1/3187/HPOL_003140-RA
MMSTEAGAAASGEGKRRGISVTGWITGLTVVTGTAYGGTAYAANKNEALRKQWIELGVPGGATALEYVGQAEQGVQRLISQVQSGEVGTKSLSKIGGDLAADLGRIQTKAAAVLADAQKQAAAALDAAGHSVHATVESAGAAASAARKTVAQSVESVTTVVAHGVESASGAVKSADVAHFVHLLHDMSAALHDLTDVSVPPAVHAKRIAKARDELMLLTNFVQHLEADQVAMIQTSLDDQMLAFNHLVDSVREEAKKNLAQQTSELELAFVAKLAEQRATLAEEHEKVLAEQLLKQADEFRTALQIDLQRQAAELEKYWSEEVKTRVDLERDGRLARLDHLALKLKYLERISMDTSEGYDRSHSIHQLQSAIRALQLVLTRPQEAGFVQEFKALKSLAVSDPFVNSILETLPIDTPSQYTSFDDLVNYLDSIKAPLRRYQLVPEDADALSFVISSFLSNFILPKHGLVAGKDLESILARAEHHLAHDNVDDAAREINQLTGWPKRLANDWLVKARRHLELQQAINIIETHLNLRSLGVL